MRGTGHGGLNATTGRAECDQNANAFANMRLRLEPAIHLSDDVRVRMQIDVFDNMVLGSTPDSFAVGPGLNGTTLDPYLRYERTAFAPYVLGGGGWYSHRFATLADNKAVASETTRDFGWHRSAGLYAALYRAMLNGKPLQIVA